MQSMWYCWIEQYLAVQLLMLIQPPHVVIQAVVILVLDKKLAV